MGSPGERGAGRASGQRWAYARALWQEGARRAQRREGQWICSAGSKGKNGLWGSSKAGKLAPTVQVCGLVNKASFRTKEKWTERPAGKGLECNTAACMGRETSLATDRGSCCQGRSGQAPLLLTRGNLWLSKKPFHSPTGLTAPLHSPQSLATSWLWTVTSTEKTMDLSRQRQKLEAFVTSLFLWLPPPSPKSSPAAWLCLHHQSDS